jgi:hydroxymethylbilane synthase
MGQGKLTIGTRGSALALWQARHVAERLERANPGLTLEQRIIKTEGDLQQQAPIGPQDRGVFVRRIEAELLAGQIDFAVHSLKDLPTDQPGGLRIAAVPERHDPRDALLSTQGFSFEALPPGSVIGTGSFRRRAQLLNVRPDLRTLPIRGNVETRIRKLESERYHAVVLAVAGLERLGIQGTPYHPIDTTICLPAVGQGALAIETRDGDSDVVDLVRVLNEPSAEAAVTAERAFLGRLGGGCLAPATAFGRFEGQTLVVDAVVGDADGRELLRDRDSDAISNAVALGERLASRMLDAGAGDLLARAREAAERLVADPGAQDGTPPR